MCLSDEASINCAVMRTWSPERSTVPSTTASTFSSRAICGRGLRACLYAITEVREIHAQRADLPEVRNQLVSHSVGEGILRRIALEAFPRKDSQGANDGGRAVRGTKLPSGKRGHQQEQGDQRYLPHKWPQMASAHCVLASEIRVITQSWRRISVRCRLRAAYKSRSCHFDVR